MKTNSLLNAIVGMGFGFPITVLCMTLMGGYNEIVAGLLVWVVASALYGILSGIMFSAKNEMALPAALGLHCLGCLLITAGAAYICGFVTDPVSFLLVLAVFAVIYAVVFALCILMMKRNEKQVNRMLNDK